MNKFRWYGFLVVAVFVPCTVAMGQGGFGEADVDGDGKVNAKELEKYVAPKITGFDRFEELMSALDTDKDEAVSESEFEKRMEAVQRLMDRGSNERADSEEPSNRREDRRDRRTREESGALKVGDMAPEFTLKSLDEETTTNLADFKNKKPVVLLFGSYT